MGLERLWLISSYFAGCQRNLKSLPDELKRAKSISCSFKSILCQCESFLRIEIFHTGRHKQLAPQQK